jgi:hypothetical protein
MNTKNVANLNWTNDSDTLVKILLNQPLTTNEHLAKGVRLCCYEKGVIELLDYLLSRNPSSAQLASVFDEDGYVLGEKDDEVWSRYVDVFLSLDPSPEELHNVIGFLGDTHNNKVAKKLLKKNPTDDQLLTIVGSVSDKSIVEKACSMMTFDLNEVIRIWENYTY